MPNNEQRQNEKEIILNLQTFATAASALARVELKRAIRCIEENGMSFLNKQQTTMFSYLSRCTNFVHGCRRLATVALPSSASSAFDFIRSQPSHYVVATVAGRKYLLAPRDLLTVPRLRDVRVGDVLTLDEIHELGSREYTLRGNPTISPDRVKVQATVLEHTKGKMEFIFKKKRRKGYQKTKKHKQTYTRLRIGSIEIPVL